MTVARCPTPGARRRCPAAGAGVRAHVGAPSFGRMRQRFLGRSGLRVSELCLGAMTFGRETDEADQPPHARRVRRRRRHVRRHRRRLRPGPQRGDPRPTGSPRGPGERVVVATKVRFPMGDGPNDLGLSRGHIARSVEASLRRLKTDHVDLYQVHALGRRDRAGGDPVDAGPARPGRQGPLRGRQQLLRLAAAEGGRHGRVARLGRLRQPAGAVQPAGPRAGVGAGPGQPQRGARDPAVEPAARWLADRPLPPRHGWPAGRHPARRGGQAGLGRGVGGLRQRPHVAPAGRHGRRRRRRRGGRWRRWRWRGCWAVREWSHRSSGPGPWATWRPTSAPWAGSSPHDQRRPWTTASDRPLPYPYATVTADPERT